MTPPVRAGRGRPRRSWRTPLLRLATLAVFLGCWLLFSASVDPLLFPSPVRVVEAYREMLETGELVGAAWTTAWTFAVSMVLAVVAGLALALLAVRSGVLGSIIDPYLLALYATPVIVMVPLIILWIGVGDVGRITLVFIGAFIPIYVNAEEGLRNVRADLVEVTASFGASRRDVVREVVIPGALPFIAAGLRIGLGRALAAIVVAEIFLSLTGLGGLIQASVGYLRVDKMVAAALVLSAAGILTMALMSRLEKRLEPWRTTT
ncbi:ABC transporter permease [Jiangella asiatica]|nr:ABC transporter permease [Jiangella asiatica]